MILMISQPMKGKTEQEIREERKELVRYLEEEGNTVIDTIISNENPDDDNLAIHYLALAINYMAKVDGVVFMKGWEKSRGCKIEHSVAVDYGKKVFYCNA